MRKKDDTCFTKAPDEEMVFVLLSRDVAAPAAIRAWVAERLRVGKNVETDSTIVEALECARTMEIEGAKWKPKPPVPRPYVIAFGQLGNVTFLVDLESQETADNDRAMRFASMAEAEKMLRAHEWIAERGGAVALCADRSAPLLDSQQLVAATRELAALIDAQAPDVGERSSGSDLTFRDLLRWLSRYAHEHGEAAMVMPIVVRTQDVDSNSLVCGALMEISVDPGCTETDALILDCSNEASRGNPASGKSIEPGQSCSRAVFVDDGWPPGQCKLEHGHAGLCELWTEPSSEPPISGAV